MDPTEKETLIALLSKWIKEQPNCKKGEPGMPGKSGEGLADLAAEAGYRLEGHWLGLKGCFLLFVPEN